MAARAALATAVFAAAAALALGRARRRRRTAATAAAATAAATASPCAGAPSAPRAVIACDLDEVLGAFVPALARYHNDTYGTDLKVDDFHSYTFCEVWGGTNEEAIVKIFDFFKTPYFLEDLQPIPGALEALTRLSERFDLYVVTSRQHEVTDDTLTWLDTHFPGIFKDALFGNHYSRDKPHPDLHCDSKRSKADMCSEIGAIALIDDNVSYCNKVSAALDIPTFLFGSYAWNQLKEGEQLHQKATRCLDWTALEKEIAKQLP